MRYSVSLSNGHVVFPAVIVQSRLEPDTDEFLADLLHEATQALRRTPDANFTAYEKRLPLSIFEWRPWEQRRTP